MANITISTTIDTDLHDQAKKHSIKWSEAIRVGILSLSDFPLIETDGQVSKETALCRAIKLQKCNAAMQEQINHLCKQLTDNGTLIGDIDTK